MGERCIMKKVFLFTLVLLTPNILAKGTIVHARGDVKVDGKKAEKGTYIPLKSRIETGANSLAVISFEGGSTVKLNEQSRLYLTKDDASKKKTNLALLKGSSFFKKLVKTKNNGGLFVKARNVSMGVRGTQFFVGYGKKKEEDVYMCVNEGKVVIKGEDQKKATLVKAGEGVVVAGGKKSSTPKPLPWTKNLNWNLDPEKELENKASIEESYSDPLEKEYD